MAVKLTEKAIERLVCEPGQRDRLLFDTDQRGLAVRVTQAGTKSYLAQYAIGGQKRRVPLGSVDAISLAYARSAAAIVMGQKAKGADPAVDRKAAAEVARAAAQRERTTFATLVDDWDRLHLSARREKYRAEATRALKKAFHEWRGRPADRLLKRDVVAALDLLTPSVARAVNAYGRACFGWGASRGTVQDNPFVGLKLATDRKRDRVLTDAEIGRIWSAADPLQGPYGPVIKILLLTGQRRDEVAGLSWQELSFDLRIWTVPPERSKNGLATIVPLSEAVRGILAAATRRRSGYVFPGRGDLQFGNWTKSKARLDAASGVSGWTVHDIRRTVATGLQRLGVRLEVTEAILNHVSGSRRGVIGIYQRHDWAVEKREALEAWARHIESLLKVSGQQSSIKLLRRA